MIALWALVLLAAAVLAWAKWVQQDIALSGEVSRQGEALAMAHSGVAMALHPLVSQKTPLLQEDFAADLGYRVRIVSEGGKLNLNWLLAGEEPRKLTLFKQWLEQKGLKFQEREILVDSLLDYVDADNVKRLNGAEDTDNYRPANRPLLSLDEVALVANSQLLTNLPGWREQLTVYSQGPIDLMAADESILRLLPGLGLAQTQRFLAFRRGKDGEDGTLDDPEIKGVREVLSLLGLGDAQGRDLGGLITVKDQTMNILSVGHSAKVIRQVEVVARKGGANPAILSWKE